MTPAAAPAAGPGAAPGLSARARRVLAGLAVVGAAAFVAGLLGGAASRAWAAFLVNLLFWSGLAFAGPAIAAIFELTEARWAARLRRVATTTVAFLPVAVVLFLVLLAGLGVLYPWVHHPPPRKAAWLNVPFFVARTVIGVAVLSWCALRFAQAVHASPAGAAQEPGRDRRARLATVLLFLFVIVGSLLGYDLVMSLDPHWFSGLLGGYFVVGTIYSGFAFLVLLVAFHSRGRAWMLPPAEMQDLAKLVFATSILWMYFFWSQYLVIWYGNVPVETRFVVARFFQDPWRTLAIGALLIGWLLPFGYLLGRLTGRPPERHGVLGGVAACSLVAMFLERTVLVYPTVLGATGAPYGLIDLLVTVGFGSAFALSYTALLPRLGLASGLEG
jgi:hypothetical protein